MFSMELEWIIRDIVDNANGGLVDIDYNTGESKREGTLFSFEVSLSYWQDGQEYNRRTRIFVVVCGHNGWCAETKYGRPFKDFDRLNWVNTGNHDSCWINGIDTWINQLYFSMAWSIADEIEENYRLENGVTPAIFTKPKRIAPRDCSMNVFIPLCEKLFTPIIGTFTKQDDNYKRVLLNIEEMTCPTS